VANTTFSELKRRVFLGFPQTDGEALLAVERGINEALQSIALVKDFDELIVLKTTGCATVASQKTYDWITHWALTRPKKILSIRLMDGTLSRKLTFIPTRELDETLPYAESLSTGRSTHYTLAGSRDIEFIPIPDAAYTLYIRYSQWPAALTAETDETPYTNLDGVTVFLAKDIANAYLSGEYFDFAQRAALYLKANAMEESRQPDHIRIARPFSTHEVILGEYWRDPFVRRTP